MKETKYRTTSNLKKLMKTPTEFKLQVMKNNKKPSAREINTRTDMASELLSEDKISQHVQHLTHFYGRDVSYKDDLKQNTITLNNINNTNNLDKDSIDRSPR